MTKIINFNPTNSNKAREYLAEIKAKLNEHNPRRWWWVRRFSDQFMGQQFDLIFCRDMEDTFTNDDPEMDNKQMLIPLYQWLEFMEVGNANSDNLLEVFLSDNYYPLDVHYYPTTTLYLLQEKPDRANFASDEQCLESFLHDDEIVPIYMVSQRGEMERVKDDNVVYAEAYFKFEHLVFFELVFRCYSLLVDAGEFKKPELLPIWHNYLELMQRNAAANNLEEIHRMFWSSYCPELQDLTNTAKGVN